MPRKSRPSLSHSAYNRTQYAAGNARPDGENADGLGAIAYCLCVPGVVDGPRLLQYRRAGLGHDIPLKPNGGTQPAKEHRARSGCDELDDNCEGGHAGEV